MSTLSVVAGRTADVPTVVLIARDSNAPSDSTLLTRIQQGDEVAMATLYDSYSRLVFSAALRVLRNRAAAEDVLQEVFLRIWRSPPTFVTARGSLGGWLSVMARNRAIDTLRRKRPAESVDDVPLCAPGNLLAELETRVLMAWVKSLIAHLPVPQQEVVELAFFKGWTQLEISQKTRTPLGTVKTRLRTALLALRSAVADGPSVRASSW